MQLIHTQTVGLRARPGAGAAPPLSTPSGPSPSAPSSARQRQRQLRARLGSGATAPSRAQQAPRAAAPCVQAVCSSSAAAGGIGRPRRREARNSRSGASRVTRCSAAASSSSSSEAPAAPSFGWASHISTQPDLDAAMAEAVLACKESLPEGQPVDLAIIFVSSHFAEEYKAVVPRLRSLLPGIEAVFGCSGYGVIGMQNQQPDVAVASPLEIEGFPAFSLTLARLPGVEISSFSIKSGEVPDGDAPPEAWAEVTGVPLPDADGAGAVPNFVVLSDPTFTEVGNLVAGLDYAYPTSPKIGGLSSAVKWDDSRTMFALPQASEEDNTNNTGLHPRGAVGLVLTGAVTIEPVVAQGCRPLGDEFTISALQQHPAMRTANVILQLMDGKNRSTSPLNQLAMLLESQVPVEQREHVQQNLMMGLAPDSFKQDLGPCNFLIRPFVGVDANAGALAINEAIIVGQKVRFMVRDAEGAEMDLTEHCLSFKKREMEAALTGKHLPAAVGALMFACNGRGEGLYERPNVDSSIVHKYLSAPVAGFFCNGEIGPVEGTTHVHGFTNVLGVLRPVAPVSDPGTGEAPT